MGKLGGRELNVSSDIDLVFVHPGEAGRRASATSAPGGRLIRLLSETTEDGFVFRVDMRLRPYGDSGPLVCNFESSRPTSSRRAASGSATPGSRRAR